MFSIAMNRTLQKYAALSLASLLAIAPTVGTAQSREYGYKDRIFERKYLITEQPEYELMLATAVAVPVRLRPRADGGPKLPSPRALQILGGVCQQIIFNEDIGGELKPRKELDEAAAKKQAESAGQPSRAPSDSPESIAQRKEHQDCVLQLAFFELASEYELSTRSQLEWLASDMRERYRNVWVSFEDANDPAVEEGARRLLLGIRRALRLQRAGIFSRQEMTSSPNSPTAPYGAQIAEHLNKGEWVAAARHGPA